MDRYVELMLRFISTVWMNEIAQFSVGKLLLHHYKIDWVILKISEVQSLNSTFLKYEEKTFENV